MAKEKKPDGSISVADWSLDRFVAYCIERREERMVHESIGSIDAFRPSDKLLEDFLDGLIVQAFRRKPDISDSATCRAHGFRNSAHGQGDQAMMQGLVSLPLPAQVGAFDEFVSGLAKRYTGLAHAREGVLMVLRVSVRAKVVPDLPFVLIFKSDYSDAVSIRDDTRVQLRNDVIARKGWKAIVYPHFDGFERDFERVKLCASASQYFDEFLWLDRPDTRSTLVGRALQDALRIRHEERFDDHFVAAPPRNRELFGEERYIPLNDLLPYQEVKFAIDEVQETLKDKTGKPVRTAIKVDTSAKVDIDLGDFGKRAFFARVGDQRVLILRGERFTTSGPLTALDFLDLEDLDGVVDRLTGAGGDV